MPEMEVYRMPRSPKKPCKYPGCPKLTDGSYCPEHQHMVDKAYEQYGRDKESKKRYGYKWRKIRARFLHAHPLCEQCNKEGRLTVATEVHHVLPLGHGGTNHEDNLMALCKPCHSRITVQMGDRWHRHR